jgi:hypothetical protein
MLYFSSLLKTPKYFPESNYTKTTFYTLVLDSEILQLSYEFWNHSNQNYSLGAAYGAGGLNIKGADLSTLLEKLQLLRNNIDQAWEFNIYENGTKKYKNTCIINYIDGGTNKPQIPFTKEYFTHTIDLLILITQKTIEFDGSIVTSAD